MEGVSPHPIPTLLLFGAYRYFHAVNRIFSSRNTRRVSSSSQSSVSRQRIATTARLASGVTEQSVSRRTDRNTSYWWQNSAMYTCTIQHISAILSRRTGWAKKVSQIIFAIFARWANYSSSGCKFPVPKLWKLDDSGQSYGKNYLAYFFWPTLYTLNDVSTQNSPRPGLYAIT